MGKGKTLWIFADGDLPPQGTEEPLGHDAVMVVNADDTDAHLNIELLFEDKEPQTDIKVTVPAHRVNCIRLDMPIGQKGFIIPTGQYALIIKSDGPVVAVFGRLDRRKNMAYYSVAGYSE